jgi:hypothetical protein
MTTDKIIKKIDPLEKICDICNTYEIMPSKAIQIYNLVMKKPYVCSVAQGLEITSRYIASHYGKKICYDEEWKLNQKHDSVRKRYWASED